MFVAFYVVRTLVSSSSSLASNWYRPSTEGSSVSSLLLTWDFEFVLLNFDTIKHNHLCVIVIIIVGLELVQAQC